MLVDGVKKTYQKPVEQETIKPKPVAQPVREEPVSTTRQSEVQYSGSVTRLSLERKLQSSGNLTPSQALNDIRNLPKPDETSPRAVADYKQQIRTIADSTIRNARPPQFEDFLAQGLNGATAGFEHRQALETYNRQIGELRAFSDEARRNPNSIVSPFEAQQQIAELPPPDRTDPNSIRDYNNRRAAIANDALLHAEPPRLEDFRRSGLNGPTAYHEYTEARRSYDAAVRELSGYAALAGSTSLLTPEAEAAARASAAELVQYVDENQFGDPAQLTGRMASEINELKAQYGDEAAALMMSELYKERPEEVFNALRLADHAPESDKQAIGRALGDGYGYLSAEEKAEFTELAAQATVADSFSTNANFGVSTTVGEILSHSTNAAMKTDVVRSMMELAATIEPKIFGDNGGVDVQALFKSAAMIADSAPAAERAEMLRNIVETLPEVNLPSLIKDNETKDALARLFMNSGEDFMHLVAPDGAIGSAAVRDGLIKLFELTLFSEGVNSERDNMMAYMVDLMKDVGDAAVQPPVSQADYEAAHNGWSQQDHVEAMSSLMAITWKAADNQKNAIKADQEQQKKTMQMFTGLAFSFVPGAGKVLGELGGEGAEFLEQVAGKVRDFAWDQARSAVQSGVDDQLAKLMSGDSLANIDSMLSSLRDTVLALNSSLPNGEAGELDLRAKFQAAFSFYQLI